LSMKTCIVTWGTREEGQFEDTPARYKAIIVICGAMSIRAPLKPQSSSVWLDCWHLDLESSSIGLNCNESAVARLKLGPGIGLDRIGPAVAPLKLECLEWSKHRENRYNKYIFISNFFHH
jgi:hypothetical protein